MMPITVKHISPPEELRHYVHHFWEKSTTDEIPFRILPDGSWDIVLRLISNTYQIDFVGPMTTALIVPLKSTNYYYGVRFLPGTYFRALKKDLSHVIDSKIQLSQIVNINLILLNQPILPQLITLIQKLSSDGQFVRSSKTDFALKLLSDPTNKDLSLSKIFHQHGLNLRTVERQFQRYVGMRPKQLQRINRLLAVKEFLRSEQNANLASLAAEFQYVDQAHMARDTRFLSGTTLGLLKSEFDDFLQDE